jgi:S-DNA-T family DNA segregation ATPase FtsK/SpoIIIE
MKNMGYILLLLLLGVVLFVLSGGLSLLKKKNRDEIEEDIQEEQEAEIVEDEEDTEKKPSFFSRLFAKKTKQENEEFEQSVPDVEDAEEEEKEEEEEDSEIEMEETPRPSEKKKKFTEITPSEEEMLLEPIPGTDILIDDTELEYVENEDLFPEKEEDFVEVPKQEEEPEEDFETAYSKLEPYDPRADLPHYIFPTLDLLKNYENVLRTREQKEMEIAANKQRIKNALENFKIYIQSISAIEGPTITLYEIVPDPGIRISKIKNLSDDIALSLKALGIRIIAPIPGKGTIGIEVPNTTAQIVPIKSVLSSEKFQNVDNMALPIVIGKTIANEPFVFDLAKMPHVLMAGATGQGKSVGLNAILASLLYKKHPAELKFVLVDPKMVELTLYTKIERHYLAKLPDAEEAIITDTKKVVPTLKSLCFEMEQRYELLKAAQCRDIIEYNNKFKSRRLNPENGHRFLPYIVLIFDEFADCIMTAGRDVEQPVARLAQKARAIGIHLIVATQRPSVNVITGLIKANFPARIAFRVSSMMDSRTILDGGGAESLIGKGDMLISTGSALTRLQCALIETAEVEDICSFIGEQRGYVSALALPEVAEEPVDGQQEIDDKSFDPLFMEAARIVVNQGHGSTSILQRKLELGYNRAGRIMDQLEREKVVGPSNGSKPRDVLIRDIDTLENLFQERNLR